MTKKVLIISFDLIRDGEAKVSFAIASLLAYLKNDVRFGVDFTTHHLSFNMLELKNKITEEYFENYLSEYNLYEFDTIAISCYIWNEYSINSFIKQIRDLGFLGKVVLGGYQISYSSKEKLYLEYPEANIFTFGYAEKSLLNSIFVDKKIAPLFLNENVDFSEIPSPYLTNEILVSENQKMVRWETKRGCPYKCSFCAHRDLTMNKVYKHEKDKILQELLLFKTKKVKRINIIDPVFNVGKDYLSYMQYIYELGLNAEITIQTRFEMIKGETGKLFLDLAEKTNAHLEFGVQTIIPAEYNAINRPNDKNIISKLLPELKSRKISYEISLIYGLPYQTLDTFRQSIDFLLFEGCENLTAFPLMLLKGTELYEQKKQFNFVEQKMGDFDIPTVVSSNSFSEQDWVKMSELAGQLKPNSRH
jgi:radical SAM superfamily enzyme YgiQ (UPF0313 family)